MATLQPQERAKNDVQASPRTVGPGPLKGAWWKWSVGLLMAYVIYGAFFIAHGAVGFGKGGNPARIVFFHVPCAVLTPICYIVSMVYAVIYLLKPRDLENDARSAASMELGFLFCLLATVTGSIFAGVQWGSFWNWDPRETSIVIMLLLYASYLVLRGALAGQPERRARLCAVYAIISVIPGQFLIWVVPRIPALNSLHPTDTLVSPDKTSWTYKGVLYPSFLAFTLLYIWLFQLRLRVNRIAERRRQRLLGRMERP